MHTRIVFGALLLILAACDPRAPFVGRYAGVYECWGAWHDGELYTEPAADQEIEIARWEGSGLLFIAGRGCPIDLRVTAHGYAEVTPGECLLELPNGDRYDVDWEGGAVYLSEPHLSYSIDVTVEPHGGPYPDRATARCYFDGTRIE